MKALALVRALVEVYMGKIMDRWSKKALSQILFLVSGVLLILCLINTYSIINIDITGVIPISMKTVGAFGERPLWLLLVFLFVRVPYKSNKLFERCYNSDKEIKYYKWQAIMFSINSIIELIASIGTVCFCFWYYEATLVDSNFNYSLIYILLIIGATIKFCEAVFCHFYYKNWEIVMNVMSKEKE